MAEWIKKILDSYNNKESDVEVIVRYRHAVGRKYDIVNIGILKKENNLYVFEYDNVCPNHLHIEGIEEDKMSFKYLPPFFTTRIPGRNRPELKEIFEDTGDDPLRILGEMACKSPVPPYTFEIKK